MAEAKADSTNANGHQTPKAVMPFPRRPLPAMMRVRQKLPQDRIADVRSDVKRKLIDSGISQRIKPGHRVAITAGSRGIGGLIELLSGICDGIRECGGEPFVIPAM